jgi:protoheme IX farnesyltransferase
MIPVLESDGQETAKIMVRNAWYLSAIPIFCSITNITSSMFALEGIALNGYALYVAYQFKNDRTNARARKVFLTSLWYLPSLLMLYLLHSKTWDEKNSEDNVLREKLAEYLNLVREQGRQLCLHEVMAHKEGNESSSDACPVVLGRKSTELTKEAAETLVASTATSAATVNAETSQ